MYKLNFALLAIVSWAASNLILRGTIEFWSPAVTGLFSRMVTLPLLAAWVLSTGDGWRRFLPRGAGGWLIVMGIVSIAANLLWFNAMAFTTATNVALLFRLDLVFVVLIGSLLGLERIRLMLMPVLLMMLVGLAMFTEIHRYEWGGHMLGDMMMIGAALGLAINAFVIRHIMRKIDEEAVAFYNYGISAFGFLGLVLLGGEFATLQLATRPTSDWLWIFSLGVILAFSLPLYYAALRRLEVWKLRTYMLTAPLLVAAIEWPLWGLEFSPVQCCGAAMILGGLVLCIRIESRAKATSTNRWRK